MKTLPLKSAHYHYLLQSYSQWLQVIGYAEPTINNWPAHVKELLHYLENKSIHSIALVNSNHLNDFTRHIKSRSNNTKEGALSGSSINTIINAVNSFARYLNSTGKYILDYTALRAENDTSFPVILTIPEIKQLYEATFLPQRENPIAMGQRDRAIIAIFYGCGLRRQEGIQLNLTDVDVNRQLVFVRRGKGGKQRYVPIATKHAADIKSYIEEGREWFLYHHYAPKYTGKYAKKKTKTDEEAFFIGQHGERMKSFYQRLHYLTEKAGIEKQFGLHNLRHSIATHFLHSGMELEEIARFLGHSSLDSTQIYTHLNNELPDG